MKQPVAAEYGVADTVLGSWLATLNQIRNLCAITPAVEPGLWHQADHSRRNKHPQWHQPVPITDDGCLAQ